MAVFSHKGVQYHVSEWGDRKNPPLVLLHGFSQSSKTWEEVAPCLAKDRFVVAPDFVGHGKTDNPTDASLYEMNSVLEFLSALLHWIWVDRVDLVGYSMGGRIGLMYAATQPHRVASLVLESSGLGPQTIQQHQAMLKRDLDLINRLRENDIKAFMDFWEEQAVFESQKSLPADVQERLRVARRENDPQALALTVRGTGQHIMPDLSRKIAILPMKVMYIAGILDRRYLKIAEKIQHYENTSCVLLNTGHNTHLEAPDSFAAQVKKFLETSSLQAV